MTMKLKIVFIDEEKNVQYEFLEYVEGSEYSNIFDVICLFPCCSLDKMISDIIDLNPDALISDYRLNEIKKNIDFNIPYNGVELVESFLEIRGDFPCFIMTSFDDDAMISSTDVNKIYIKEILHTKENEKGAKVGFLGRVKKQIENYKARVFRADQELEMLLRRKQNTQLSLEEEERIIVLDSFLEYSIDRSSVIPAALKIKSNDEKLKELLKKADNIIQKLGGVDD